MSCFSPKRVLNLILKKLIAQHGIRHGQPVTSHGHWARVTKVQNTSKNSSSNYSMHTMLTPLSQYVLCF